MSERRLGAHDGFLKAITVCLRQEAADDEGDHDEREAKARYGIIPMTG